MKKRILKLTAFAAALALLAGVLWFSNGLLGNPVSKFLAARAAREYLAGQYPGADYQVESVNYSFKFGGYTAAVVSPVKELDWKGDKVFISGGKIGELTQKLYDTLTGIQWGKLPDTKGWIVPVCKG